MRCGISTSCLYPMETTESLQTLLHDGHRRFEIFFNTFSELSPEYLERMQSLLAAHDASVCSVHPFTSGYEGILLFSNYEPRFVDSLQFYRHYFRAAQQLGARYLILHGMLSQFRSVESEKRYFERYRALYRLGQEYDVTVAQENVTRFFAEEPAFILRMREALGDECAFCFDVKQAVRSEVDWREMLDAMGEKLVHVHLNDNAPGQTCLVPGEGTMDFPAFFAHLTKLGYDGDVMIEVYRSNFEECSALVRCRNRVEAYLSL